MKNQRPRTDEQIIWLLIQYHVLQLRFLDQQLQRLKKSASAQPKTPRPKSWPIYRWQNSNN